MFTDRKGLRLGLTDIVLFLANVIFFAGIRWWFPVCDVMGENVMACYWAGNVLKALSWLLLALCVFHVFFDYGVKQGIDIGIAGLMIMAAFIPGTVIRICANSAMHCHNTLLMTRIFSAVTVTLAALDGLFYAAKRAGKKHERPERPSKGKA